MNSNPLEKDIERAVCDYAKKQFKMLCYKFTSPGQRSVPDRIFVTKEGVVFFIEFKRLGQKPTPAQEVEIAKIRAQGVKVFVVDNVGEGKRVVDQMSGRDLLAEY
jgi:hypothetical protein